LDREMLALSLRFLGRALWGRPIPEALTEHALAALETYLEVARKELRKEGVRLVLVRLPAVATPLWAPLGGPPRGAQAPDEAARKVLEAVLADAGDVVEL
jgi:NAD(P)-dependent dehydrogenase (short-subunit alcohol dehydrogenase family)